MAYRCSGLAGGGARLCCLLFCLFLVSFAFLSSSPLTTVSISEGGEIAMKGIRSVNYHVNPSSTVMSAGKRSLMVTTDDYGDPTANRGHDPPAGRSTRTGVGSRG